MARFQATRTVFPIRVKQTIIITYKSGLAGLDVTGTWLVSPLALGRRTNNWSARAVELRPCCTSNTAPASSQHLAVLSTYRHQHYYPSTLDSLRIKGAREHSTCLYYVVATVGKLQQAFDFQLGLVVGSKVYLL